MKRLIYSETNPLQNRGLDYYLKEEDLLYVVPYFEMQNTMREKLLRNSKEQAIELNNIISLDHLFRELYFKVDGQSQILTDNELKYILEEVLKSQDYDYFDHNSVKYLLEFINNIDAEMIDLSKYEGVDSVLRELVEIYQQFQAKLKGSGFISKWQAYQVLLDKLSAEDFTYLYPELKRIFLARFYVIRGVELELILKLAEYVEDFVILIDYHQQKKKLFSNLDSVVARLEAEGFVLVDKTSQDNRLIQDLFSNQIKAEKYNWEQYLEHKLQIVEAKSRMDELNFVAKKIRELAQTGIALDRIGLAFSRPEDYLPDLDRVFADYNLVYDNRISLPLLASPVAKAAFALLEVLDGNFDHQQLLAVVDNDLINFGLGRKITDDLELVLKSLRFEVEGWKLINNLEEEVQVDELEEVNQVLRLFREVLEWDLKEKVQFRKFVGKLSELLIELKFGLKVDLANNDDLLAAWQGIQGIIEGLNKVFGTEKRAISQWIDLLQEAMLEGKYKPANQRGIKVTGNLELRAGDFDYIFLLGMSQSQYPAVSKEPLKGYLELLGVDLEDKQVKDRYTLFNNILAANKEVIVTYSSAIDEDQPLLTSYLQELFRVVDQEQILGKIAEGNKVIYSTKEAQKVRGASKEVSSCQGLLEDEDNLRWLENKFNADYNYSAHMLEKYNSCPFAFLVDHIFELGTVEYNEEVHNVERGRILHQIVEEFHGQFGDRVNDDNYQFAEEKLLNVVEQVLSNYPLFEKNFYWQAEGHRYLQDKQLGPIFEEFLAAEKEAKLGRTKIDDFSFAEAEWEFKSLEVIEGYKFSGRVDRIDYNQKQDVYGVIDYKSGKVTNKNLTTNPIQIPLYIMAVEKEFGADVAFGSYYGLRPDDRIGCKKIINSGVIQKTNQDQRTEEFRARLEETKELIKSCIQGIKQGKYSLEEEQSGCSYCQSQLFCRKEEL
ncbi:PD-(D/E)XK nuclease family protein [Natroniella sulfidigena]|uniref:PD-(D/E)XK nuclease family protein n=1 Tax=Natroniella sulfidigena TaxID=723921 RepID=UPI002009E02F|nr:PD-(D/E)XK nuclease family protein [Natroniella sulfidigena]MCK8817592.1 PD-(D/E)XK nuclease family protein [Natroniella sulfidigena]